MSEFAIIEFMMLNARRADLGFTLLEVLVVIIIVGVLAAVALPSLFRNIERARAAEAIATIGIIKRNIDGCVIMRNNAPLDYTGCDTWDAIGMKDPSQNAGNNGALFNYTITVGGGLGFMITATRTTVLTGGSATGSINFDYRNDGSLLRNGSSDYAGYQ
jgi:prepilin-type N-terminal cleavage/methylation domain-containing protein